MRAVVILCGHYVRRFDEAFEHNVIAPDPVKSIEGAGTHARSIEIGIPTEVISPILNLVDSHVDGGADPNPSTIAFCIAKSSAISVQRGHWAKMAGRKISSSNHRAVIL